MLFFSDMDKQKGYLIDAYLRLGCAQADVIVEKDSKTAKDPVTTTGVEVSISDLDETVREIQKWTDMNDSKVRGFMDLFFSL